MMTKSPNPVDVLEEYWSEVMGKGTVFGKRDTTLSHRHTVTFSRKIIPVTVKRPDEEGMSRLKSRIQTE
jgi:hypothetical protein